MYTVVVSLQYTDTHANMIWIWEHVAEFVIVLHVMFKGHFNALSFRTGETP
jgi:hypothetical protein